MRYLILLLVGLYTSTNLDAQPQITPIADTIYNQDGARYNGPLTITLSAKSSTSGGSPVLSTVAQLRITNGVLNASLAPNTTMTPAGSTYLIRFGNGGVKTCSFPPSATPLSLANYCSDNPPANPSPSIPLPWLNVSGYSNGYYCIQVLNGAASLSSSGCPGSGGGPLLLSTLTDGQLLTLSNGQLLTLQN